MGDNGLRALALVCTLKPSPARSSSQLLADQVLEALGGHGVVGEAVRVADHDVGPGVTADAGDGDAWPNIRARMLEADILVLATPIWLGHPCSVARRVLERLDGELSETDDEGRMLTYGKAAAVAVVGNEVGFSLAPDAVTYWVGEAMQGTDYQDLDGTPDSVRTATESLAANTAHLARTLRGAPYPPA